MYVRMATRNGKERKLHQRHQDKFYYDYKSINKTRGVYVNYGIWNGIWNRIWNEYRMAYRCF